MKHTVHTLKNTAFCCCLCILLLLPAVLQGQVAAPSAMQENTAVASGSMVDRVTGWYRGHLNYGTVALLMAVESSFIPFPSEVVVPPAAYWACQAGSPMDVTGSAPLNVLLVVLAASLGAMIGAVFNYCIALWLGRPIIYRFADSKVGRCCLLSSEKVQKAEAYFLKYGKTSTLIGRLVPVVRQLISIPAGLARMRPSVFLLFTFIGATCWNFVLAAFGYLAHGQQELIEKYSHEISVAICVCGVLFIGWLLYKGFRKK